MSNSKFELPSTNSPSFLKRKFFWKLLAAAALVLFGTHLYLVHNYEVHNLPPVGSGEDYCPQGNILVPRNNRGTWETIGRLLVTEEFKLKSAELLGGAVRIPTQTYDDMGNIGEDPRWDVQKDMHAYWKTSFPNVYKNLNPETINTYGLLYTWKGSDPSLKPLLMMAHSDVVPVDPSTVDQWDHPPFSGYFDGEKVWGRGSSDDKSGLVGTLIAIETLLETSFVPERTIVLAFGFDEEIGGIRGASQLAARIQADYGENSFALIIDEGGGFTEKYGTVFAAPGVVEKGIMNVRIDVSSPGGHSSVPPSHTSIGMLAAVLVEYENNPYPVHFARESPMYAAFQCFAQFGTALDPSLRQNIKESVTSDRALSAVEEVLFQDNTIKSLIGTTQAADMIGGGVKTNALPENAYAVVNHRIATQSTVNETKEHDTNLLKSLAAKFNLTYTAFDQLISEGDKGVLTLTAPIGSDPAPVTPIHGKAYEVLSGTIQATFHSHRGLDLEEEGHIYTSPGMPSGNTDTRYYWNISENIFRYTHHNLGKVDNALAGGVHTVNERMEIDAFLETIRFYVTLILNLDENRDI